MENLKLILNLKNYTAYNISDHEIVKIIKQTLIKYKIFGRVELGLQIVGRNKIRNFNRKYRNIDKATDVLSFPQIKDTKIPLKNIGDIVICYQEALKNCKLKTKDRDLTIRKQQNMIDKEIIFLVEHGLKHLLGIHHK